VDIPVVVGLAVISVVALAVLVAVVLAILLESLTLVTVVLRACSQPL
jgi:hypothetical protein